MQIRVDYNGQRCDRAGSGRKEVQQQALNCTHQPQQNRTIFALNPLPDATLPICQNLISARRIRRKSLFTPWPQLRLHPPKAIRAHSFYFIF
jgi:hypothetical protein